MKFEFLTRRIGAYLLDSIIVQFICVFITNAFDWDKNLGSFPFLGREFTISFSCYFILLLAYLFLMDLMAKGTTIGKSVFKVKTVGLQGQQLPTSKLLLRSFLKTISLCLLLPLVYMLSGQTLHDWAVKSRTIRV